MLSLRATLKLPTHRRHRFYCSQNVLRSVPTITGPLDWISVEDFRAQAFVPGNPLLITAGHGQSLENAGERAAPSGMPAADKWFIKEFTSPSKADASAKEERAMLSTTYLSPFASTILPYELFTASKSYLDSPNSELSRLLDHYL